MLESRKLSKKCIIGFVVVESCSRLKVTCRPMRGDTDMNGDQQRVLRPQLPKKTLGDWVPMRAGLRINPDRAMSASESQSECTRAGHRGWEWPHTTMKTNIRWLARVELVQPQRGERLPVDVLQRPEEAGCAAVVVCCCCALRCVDREPALPSPARAVAARVSGGLHRAAPCSIKRTGISGGIGKRTTRSFSCFLYDIFIESCCFSLHLAWLKCFWTYFCCLCTGEIGHIEVNCLWSSYCQLGGNDAPIMKMGVFIVA